MPAKTPPTTVTAAHTATPACAGPVAVFGSMLCRRCSAWRCLIGRARWAPEGAALRDWPARNGADAPRRRDAARNRRAELRASRGNRTAAHRNGGAPPSTVRRISRATSRVDRPGRMTTRSVEFEEYNAGTGTGPGPMATANAAVRSATAPGEAHPPADPAPDPGLGRATASTKVEPAARARFTRLARAAPTGATSTLPSSASLSAHPPAWRPRTLRGAPTVEGRALQSPCCGTVDHGMPTGTTCHQGKHARDFSEAVPSTSGDPHALVHSHHPPWPDLRKRTLATPDGPDHPQSPPTSLRTPKAAM